VVVFTLPEQLRALARVNPERIYGLLFTAARITLATLAEQKMEARLGVTAVLHTWTREMHLHPHLHCVVTGGGLSMDDDRWVKTRNGHLFSVHLMGSLFRGIFMRRLRAMRAAGALKFAGPADKLAEQDDFDRFAHRMYRTRWVVYAKRPFAGPDAVVGYLGRYTLRHVVKYHVAQFAPLAASPSPTTGCSRCKTTACASGPRTAAMWTSRRRHLSRAGFCTCFRPGSTRSGTSGSIPPAASVLGCPRRWHCSACRR